MSFSDIIISVKSWTDVSCSGFESSESSQGDSDEEGDIESSPGRLKNDVRVEFRLNFLQFVNFILTDPYCFLGISLHSNGVLPEVFND